MSNFNAGDSSKRWASLRSAPTYKCPPYDLRAHDKSCPAQPGVIEGASRGHAP
jgi:hypothetical protein